MENDRPEPKAKQPQNELEQGSADERLAKMKHDFRWPKPSEQAIASALQAIQRLGVDGAFGSDGPSAMTARSMGVCPKCGAENAGLNRFCGFCGAQFDKAARTLPKEPSAEDGQHVIHHHHHHHYFPGKAAGSLETAFTGVTGEAAVLHNFPLQPAIGAAPPEAAVRKLAQDWAMYCNSKRVEELVGLYLPDAIVLRPNVEPARGQTAIRQLLRTALESGLGDVELDGSESAVLGEMACLTGRNRMLFPVATGQRQERTGKYLLVARREGSEWKILADSWSVDATGGRSAA